MVVLLRSRMKILRDEMEMGIQEEDGLGEKIRLKTNSSSWSH